MKRRALIIIACLVLGAIVNMCVAWRCAAPAQAGVPQKFDAQARSDGWVVQRYAGRNWEIVYGWRWASTRPSDEVIAAIPAWSHFHRDPPAMRDGERFGEIRTERAAGWPCLALAYMERSENLRTHVEWAIAPPIAEWWYPESWPQTQLPLRPTWPGFSINTAFYAGMFWMLIGFPFTLRRWCRHWRHRCVACGYPVGRSAICTECGKPVKPRE